MPSAWEHSSRSGALIALTRAALVLSLATPLASAQLPYIPPAILVDDDRDGLFDAEEQRLAERYAPVVYHSSDESNFPTNVDWILDKTFLWFYDDDCLPDLEWLAKARPAQADLLRFNYTGGCGRNEARNIDGTITRTVYSDGTRSLAKHRTFYLQDLPEQFHRGSGDTTEWTTYFHAYPNDAGGATIQYWRVYAYNDAANDHGGDWEGVHIQLGPALEPVAFGFLGHTSIETVSSAEIQWEDAHPRIYSEGGGHASHPRGSTISAIGCPPGPAPLRPCYIDPANKATFVKQQAWTGGMVEWPNGQRTPGGRLLNVGEKLNPLNQQVFIQYSGLWGSPGKFYFTSGYWGPAFNETAARHDAIGMFVTAWCDRMSYERRGNADWVLECHPKALTR